MRADPFVAFTLGALAIAALVCLAAYLHASDHAAQRHASAIAEHVSASNAATVARLTHAAPYTYQLTIPDLISGYVIR